MEQAPDFPTRLLLCSRESSSLLAMQAEVFRNSGYKVITAASNGEIQEHIENTDFEVIVLNHTISFADRKLLARKTKSRNPASGVMVLHHSGSLGNPYVDLAVDSRTGVSNTLLALKRVEAMLHARCHLGDLDGQYVVVADLNRNYSFVSDAVCDLLGYDRAMLLEMRIDDIVAGSTPIAAPLFHDFVAEGRQAGRIVLRHRFRRLVQVEYQAVVEPDGCTIARWEPLENVVAN